MRVRSFAVVGFGLVAVLLAGGCQRGGPVIPGSPAAPSAAGAAAAGTVVRSLTVDGRERSYRAHAPAAGGVDLPVMIVLHGGGGNGELAERQTGFSELADEAGFLAVYPDGTARAGGRLLTWNAGNCCGFARDNDIDDVAFIGALLDDLAKRYPVDLDRVGVTGLSNGAMMSYRIGCELSSRVTIIASVAGAMNVDGCQPARPVAVLAVHGTADDNVPYAGGRSTGRGVGTENDRVDQSVGYAIQFWAEHNACGTTPKAEGVDGPGGPVPGGLGGAVGPGGSWVPEPSAVPDGTVIRTTYSGCARGADVVLYSVGGGGHAWPGGTKIRPRADDAPDAPDASHVIWEFLAAHSPTAQPS
ncbi:polyhydroxybutyrate depolymerase [Parafrankia sp. EAN1pec]|uniref:alpha/beta hydrolase family esterase n=1 Tax=Parafrankia sp. (strain EAN1pec) TaxID=298653 RepID=UPI0000541FF9|nr:polyhydroxybutyrate depolymerase [Frankia sp. EAN1pec]